MTKKKMNGSKNTKLNYLSEMQKQGIDVLHTQERNERAYLEWAKDPCGKIYEYRVGDKFDSDFDITATITNIRIVDKECDKK